MRKRIAGLLPSIFLGLFLTTGCVTGKLVKRAPPEDIPLAPREFRAAWVASVSNINWPSTPGLSTWQQQQEAIDLLDLLHKNNFNAVILQVRPQCDALYASELEPWSYFLTGKQGIAPAPYYDPLAFWIEEAHDRGIELHAWFNPYRAHIGESKPCAESIVNRHPELVKRLENGTYWMDPALKATQDHSYNVVIDVVRRYDVDGIHFDDYFYPYPEYNGGKDFPDYDSWREYINNGGRLHRNDWRRDAVNKFIKRLYQGIKKEKRYVKFGLSPFGIWRPGYPASIAGLDQYDVLYADARLWLNKGWIDYWTPQLYWPVNQIPQSFPVLLEWWNQENNKRRHFWPGLNISRGADECLNQIMITRGILPESPGTVHWSIGSLMGAGGGELTKALVAGPYANKALVPSSPWLDRKAPAAPVVHTAERNGELVINFTHPNDADVFHWVVYLKKEDNWRHEILNRKDHTYSAPLEQISQFAVSAVDRTGNESAIKLVHITK